MPDEGQERRPLHHRQREGDDTRSRITADYGYYRLRDEGYGEADISRWAETVVENASDGRDAFVYFKHEERARAPEFAQALLKNLADG